MSPTKSPPMTAGGSITTTYDAQTVTTTGSPPSPAQHKTAVIERFNSVPLNMTGGPGNPIVTRWYSNGGPQLIEVNHSPPSQTSEQWRRAWIQTYDSATAAQVPV